MGFTRIVMAYQRWQVALKIRDGKWRSIDQISELVGFDAEPCLVDEERGAKNFQRAGKQWKMKPEAIRCLERNEQMEPYWPRPKKPKAVKGNLLAKKRKGLF